MLAVHGPWSGSANVTLSVVPERQSTGFGLKLAALMLGTVFAGAGEHVTLTLKKSLALCVPLPALAPMTATSTL